MSKKGTGSYTNAYILTQPFPVLICFLFRYCNSLFKLCFRNAKKISNQLWSLSFIHNNIGSFHNEVGVQLFIFQNSFNILINGIFGNYSDDVDIFCGSDTMRTIFCLAISGYCPVFIGKITVLAAVKVMPVPIAPMVPIQILQSESFWKRSTSFGDLPD